MRRMWENKIYKIKKYKKKQKWEMEIQMRNGKYSHTNDMTMNHIEVIEKKKKTRKRVGSELSNLTLVWFSVLSCMVGVVCVVLCCVVVSPLFLFFSVLVCGCKERKEQKEKRERYRHTHEERERERGNVVFVIKKSF